MLQVLASITATTPHKGPCMLQSSQLQVDFAGSDARALTVSVNGTVWLAGTGFLAQDDGLHPGPALHSSGTDELGDFESLHFHWSGASNNTLRWTTSVRSYTNVEGDGLLVFRQEFPAGAGTPSGVGISTGAPPRCISGLLFSHSVDSNITLNPITALFMCCMSPLKTLMRVYQVTPRCRLLGHLLHQHRSSSVTWSMSGQARAL